MKVIAVFCLKRKIKGAVPSQRVVPQARWRTADISQRDSSWETVISDNLHAAFYKWLLISWRATRNFRRSSVPENWWDENTSHIGNVFSYPMKHSWRVPMWNEVSSGFPMCSLSWCFKQIYYSLFMQNIKTYFVPNSILSQRKQHRVTQCRLSYLRSKLKSMHVQHCWPSCSPIYVEDLPNSPTTRGVNMIESMIRNINIWQNVQVLKYLVCLH